MNSDYIIALISQIRDKANKILVYEMNQRNIQGLAPSHGSIFAALFYNSKLTMKELAEKINKDKSTVTALVDKLVSYGYVEKTRDEMDTRVVYVTLTEKGKNLKPDIEEISSKLLDQVYKDVSKDEQEILMKILLKIKNNL